MKIFTASSNTIKWDGSSKKIVLDIDGSLKGGLVITFRNTKLLVSSKENASNNILHD